MYCFHRKFIFFVVSGSIESEILIFEKRRLNSGSISFTYEYYLNIFRDL